NTKVLGESKQGVLPIKIVAIWSQEEKKFRRNPTKEILICRGTLSSKSKICKLSLNSESSPNRRAIFTRWCDVGAFFVANARRCHPRRRMFVTRIALARSSGCLLFRVLNDQLTSSLLFG
ncbi:12060_t:CDS:2, partial [Acaulospora morrowiae]